MESSYFFDVVDRGLALGFFAGLAGEKYVLRLHVKGTGWSTLHRADRSFTLFCPCRIWVVSGKVRYLVGDSAALPGEVIASVRPPWTG